MKAKKRLLEINEKKNYLDEKKICLTIQVQILALYFHVNEKNRN